MRFANSKVVVTGACGVFGTWIAEAFAREGATLCLSDNRAADLAALAARLGPDSPQWQQLVPLCVERLLEAEHEGYPEEQVAERLAVLGQPRGVPMGEAARVPA